MRNSCKVRRPIWSALAVAVCLAIGVSVALAATARVTLNLKGGYKNHQEVACGDLHHYTYFHKGARIKFDGTVSPAPSGQWRVKLKLKRCSNGAFRTVYQHHFRGRQGGRFDGGFSRQQRGHYYARIYYYGVSPTAESEKQHFRIK